MAQEVVELLLGGGCEEAPGDEERERRRRRQSAAQPVRLYGYERFPVKGHVYPGLVRCGSGNISKNKNAYTDGILLTDLNFREMQRLDWFEGDEYERIDVRVVPLQEEEDQRRETTTTSQVDTQAFLWVGDNSSSDSKTGRAKAIDLLDVDKGDWSYERFRRTNLDWYLQNTVGPCRLELDQLFGDGGGEGSGSSTS